MERLGRYLPSTRSIPKNSNSSFDRESLPALSDSKLLSIERICDTLATESLGSSVTLADRLTFPGAKAHLMLLVSGTQITVAMRLWFRASDWMMITGRRKPGPEPVGSGGSAHQISPCEITTPLAPECGGQRLRRMHLAFLHRRLRLLHDSSPQ